MKTERITILATPTFKAAISKRAQALRIPTSELVRRAVESYDPDHDEESLNLLVEELEQATKKTEKKLDEALAELTETLEILQSRRREPAR